MPSVNPDCYHLSASSISSFKACPTRFRLSYREGLRPAADTDSQRMGTNWHAMHEVYANALVEFFPPAERNAPGGKGLVQPGSRLDQALERVVEHLNKQYAECPNWKTPLEWALERQILFVSFVGYLWYFQNDPIEVLASEVAFDLPLHAPRTGMPLPMKDVVRVGKIDHVIKWQGMIGCQERKSTSRSIDPTSDYWDKSKKDTQVSMYALAFRDMRVTGYGDGTPSDREEIAYADPYRPGMMAVIDLGEKGEVSFGNTLYDVWHKPTIKPCVLSQKDTAEFLETGVYCGATFAVRRSEETAALEDLGRIWIDGEEAELSPGKKGFAIRETVGMFGARLLADIYERPDFYYARREIARTDAEITKFRGELFNIYQAMKMFTKGKCWYENESQCRATFPCPHIGICYGPGADAVCDGETTPPGYKRIFVDLKVAGKDIAED